MTKSKSEKSEPEIDFQDMIRAHLDKTSPRKDDIIYEVSLTREEVLSKIQYVLTSGIPSYDDLVGGMPFGRIVELYGLESCGKTAMVIRCASRARRGFISEVIRDENDKITYRQLDPEEYTVAVVYIDNERSLDDDSKLMVDGEKLDIIGTYCDTVDMLFKQIDDSIDGLEAAQVKFKKKKLFMVIIVDTIASTSNKQEQAQAWGKQDYSRAPQQYSQGFRKLVRKVNRNNVCLICTNQVRDNMKAQAEATNSGRPLRSDSSLNYTSFGGHALRFYASHRVFMAAMQSTYKLMPKAQFAAGLKVSFQSVKNRLKMPKRTGHMVLLFDEHQGGFSAAFSTLETLVLLKSIEMTKKEAGTDFVCHFNKHGIKPTTFDVAETEESLDEADDKVVKRRGRVSKKEPGFTYRADWPSFYAKHEADIKLLWDAAILEAFTTEGLNRINESEDDLLIDDDAISDPTSSELED